ncbi:hypothetical protein JCM3766R1_003960 [Sporobolomyces carnicolor]
MSEAPVTGSRPASPVSAAAAAPDSPSSSLSSYAPLPQHDLPAIPTATTNPNNPPLLDPSTSSSSSTSLPHESIDPDNPNGLVGIGIATNASHLTKAQAAPPQPPPPQQTVPVEFDEAVLRTLCDSDCGLPLLLDRLKQSMTSCRETSTFLKKRAQIEEEYARSMSKLVKSSIDSYGLGDGKAGSFVNSYLSLLKTHDLLSDNRSKFAHQLSDMAEELSTLSREVDKVRKSSKEVGQRLDKHVLEQEQLVDKARARFDSAAEELERFLLIKSGESITPTNVPHAAASGSSPSNSSTSQLANGSISSGAGGGSGGGKGRSLMSKLKGGPKNPAQVAKQEEELRSRMGQASDSYRAMVLGSQSVKQEYFNQQLPKLLRTLKEGTDELDLGTQYHLSRYAYLFESLLVTDGLTVSPVSIEDGPGVKAVIEAIDSREDFKTFLQQYTLNWQMSGQKGPKRDVPAAGTATGSSDYYYASSSGRPQLSPRSSSSQLSPPSSSAVAITSQPTFGVDLGEQMMRDAVETPRVLEKCAEAIERHGLDSMGIYRLSGTTSRVQRLKLALDRDLEGTDLLSEENLSDINDIAAVLKLWFRELPEPLLTWELYHQFIDVAKIENDRLRHIRLHERVNELPDPNYATLKFLMGHLDKVAARDSINQMSVSNLAIVFGPNLLSPPPPHLAHHFPPPPQPSASATTNSSATPTPGVNGEGGVNGQAVVAGGSTSLADTQWKCKCVETILAHYKEIFVE